jgi:hypothetical protein
MLWRATCSHCSCVIAPQAAHACRRSGAPVRSVRSMPAPTRAPIALWQSLNLRRVAVHRYSTLSGHYEPDATVACTSRPRLRPAALCTAGAAPSARRCTARCKGISRPTWRSRARGAAMARACRGTWSGSFAAIWSAAFSPTASPVPGAGSADTISWSIFLAKAAGCALVQRPAHG